MIPNDSPRSTEQAALIQLRDDLTQCVGDRDLASAVLAAVTMYCGENAPKGWWPAWCMDVVVARALSAVGGRDASRRWLRVRFGEPEASLWSARLDAMDEVPADAIYWLAARFVRIESWAAAHGRPLWVIDVSRPGGQFSDLPLVSHAGLRRAIELISPAWDGLGGLGELGLRGCREGTRAEDGPAAYARDVLERLSVARGWRAIPQVWALDG